VLFRVAENRPDISRLFVVSGSRLGWRIPQRNES
jgi:hypothetical protein